MGLEDDENNTLAPAGESSSPSISNEPFVPKICICLFEPNRVLVETLQLIEIVALLTSVPLIVNKSSEVIFFLVFL